MKEIDFRVWDNARGQWLDFDAVYDMVKRVGVLGTDYGDRYSIEQFSGIVDRHGVGIYEGDVVEFRRRASSKMSRRRGGPRVFAYRFAVEFERGEFSCGRPGFNWLTDTESGYEMEVVGNVHQGTTKRECG